MTMNQLFLALLGTLLALFAAFYKLLEGHLDTKFNGADKEFEGVNSKLDLLLEHFSRVEKRAKNS